MTSILYVSTLCSPELVENLFETSSVKPGQEVQKYHRLLVEGMAEQKLACVVETLTSIPVIPSGHSKKIWNLNSEENNRVRYNYIPFLNYPLLRSLLIFIYSFFYVIIWGTRKSNGQTKKILVCDVLNFTGTLSAWLASSLIGIKSVAIVTDIPELMTPGSNEKITVKRFFFNRGVAIMVKRFSGYILMTEKMNEIVNPQKKPFLVIEGVVDLRMSSIINDIEMKVPERIVMYAGGIYEKYGIKKLIDAFHKLDGDDLRLHIYGSGEMELDMPIYMQMDGRIDYKGLVLNREIIAREIIATLLVNPRSSKEIFASYSFPSKNMEYMASGTPIMTTKLPAMPKEYYPFVYMINDESVEGLYEILKNILSKSREELHLFGKKAREFVLDRKNNIIQGKSMLEFYDIL